jgi:hypothetical protein
MDAEAFFELAFGLWNRKRGNPPSNSDLTRMIDGGWEVIFNDEFAITLGRGRQRDSYQLTVELNGEQYTVEQTAHRLHGAQKTDHSWIGEPMGAVQLTKLRLYA